MVNWFEVTIYNSKVENPASSAGEVFIFPAGCSQHIGVLVSHTPGIYG
jgi:hypothetical protein